MGRFHRDRGIPEVERLARACCIARGRDPDEQTRETGYDDTTIPRWWFFQDAAQDFLAMMAAGPAPTVAGPTLIAAAPDQLPALKALVVVHRQQDTRGVMPADKAIAYGRAEAAIAAAEGRAPSPSTPDRR